MGNVRYILCLLGENEVETFTVGSAIVNPQPNKAGAVVYLKRYQSSPVLLKKIFC